MEDLTIDDPANVAGMSFLIDTSGLQNGFDPHELEAEIIGKSNFSKKKGDLAKELEHEIDRVTSNNRDFKFKEPSSNQPFSRPSMTTTTDDLDELLRSVDSLSVGGGNDNNQNSNDDDLFGFSSPTINRPQQQFSQSQRPSNNAHNLVFDDPRLNYMTNEEKRQNVIGDVFDDMENEHGGPIFSIEKEKEEDEKARKLESISFLRETLEDEGEDLSRIPNVTHANTLEEIDAVHRLLILKNDRKRCCGFAEECILMGAHGVEWAFDGERNWFGYKPDMTDWHKSVQGKLRRMRHDTSNVVGNIMQSYNLGSGTRILLELIPSMFLYSRMRKAQHKDNLVSDAEFNDGINTMMDYAKAV